MNFRKGQNWWCHVIWDLWITRGTWQQMKDSIQQCMVFFTWKAAYKELDTFNVPWAIVKRKKNTSNYRNFLSSSILCRVPWYIKYKKRRLIKMGQVSWKPAQKLTLNHQGSQEFSRIYVHFKLYSVGPNKTLAFN